MTAVVEPDPQVARQLEQAVGDAVTVFTSVSALEEHLNRQPGEYAVLLGPSVADREAAALADRYRVTRPRVGVVLVRPIVDQDVLATALRSGMREVVTPTDADGIREAVARAGVVAQALDAGTGRAGDPARTGSVLTVFATKGGVGKSVVAVNVATALADLGRRTCLVDLDLADGDVAVLLRATPQHTLADLDGLGDELDATGVGALLAQHGPNLSVLAAPPRPGVPVPAERIASVLGLLRTMFEHVVIDTSGNFDDVGLAALDASDVLVLVGTLDVPSLKSLKLAVATLDLLNLPRERWRLVLNRVDSKVGLSVSEFQETLGLQPEVTIGSSRDLLAAVNRGEQIVRSQPRHRASKALRAFAEVIDREGQPDATAAGGSLPDRRHRGRRSAADQPRTREVS